MNSSNKVCRKFSVILSHNDKSCNEQLTNFVLEQGSNIAGYSTSYLAVKQAEGILLGLINSDYELDKDVVVAYNLNKPEVDFREMFNIPDNYMLELVFTSDAVVALYPSAIMMAHQIKNPTGILRVV